MNKNACWPDSSMNEKRMNHTLKGEGRRESKRRMESMWGWKGQCFSIHRVFSCSYSSSLCGVGSYRYQLYPLRGEVQRYVSWPTRMHLCPHVEIYCTGVPPFLPSSPSGACTHGETYQPSLLSFLILSAVFFTSVFPRWTPNLASY